MDSQSLKTAVARIEVMRKDIHEAFQEVALVEPEVQADVPNVQTTTDDAPPVEDAAQP